MLKVFEKKSLNKRDPVDKSNFLPYACYYNDAMLLTKNGELLQVIKISGAEQFLLEQKETRGIKQCISKFLEAETDIDKLTLWISVLRSSVDCTFEQNFDNEFSKILNQHWVQSNNWKQQYENNLYITIVHQSEFAKINYLNPLSYCFTSASENAELQRIENAANSLTQKTNKLVSMLKQYNPLKLSAKNHAKEGSSEILDFLQNILCLSSNTAMERCSLSRQILDTSQFAFDEGVVKIVNTQNVETFCTLLTLKDYSSLTNAAIDRLLNVDAEIVITEIIQASKNQPPPEAFKYQDYVLRLGNAKELRESLIAVNPTISNSGKVTYASTQTILSILGQTRDVLQAQYRLVSDLLAELGVPSVREDLHLEHCFWSQLPANFRLVDRTYANYVQSSANFASIQGTYSGKHSSPWGKPVAILKTALGTPYFFNFHGNSNPHTLIAGENLAQKRSLLHFLISQSNALGKKVFYLDHQNGAELFAAASAGVYKTFSFDPKTNQAPLNPLLLEDTKNNRKFIEFWFVSLIDKYRNPKNLDKYLEAIAAAVDEIFKMPKEKRKIHFAKEFFSNIKFDKINASILKRISKWTSDTSPYYRVFNSDKDLLQSEELRNAKMAYLDISDVHNKDISISLPILVYLIYYFIEFFAKKAPGILAIAEANDLLNNSYFEQNLESILDDIYTANSCMAITASYNEQLVNWNKAVSKIFATKMDTQIFSTEHLLAPNVSKIFQFSDSEQKLFVTYSGRKNKLLIRQNGRFTPITFNIATLQKLHGILSNSKHAKKILDPIIKEHKDKPGEWLSDFLETEQNSDK